MTKIAAHKKSLLPQLRFKEFDGEWEKKKLGDICTFFSGGTPTSTNKKFYDGEIPFIGSGNINDSEVFNFITHEALESSSAKMVKVGDLLYALYGANSGELAISKMSGAINQAILCIRTKKENIQFIFSLLLSNKERIVCKYLQGGQGNLSSKIVKNLKYHFPSLKEQQKIATFLTAVDDKISQLTRKKDQLTQYKKGVMQRLFPSTGSGQVPELRFKPDASQPSLRGDHCEEERRGKLTPSASNENQFPDWEEKRLGEVATFKKGKSISKSDIVENGDLECIRYGELYTEYGEVISNIKSRTNLTAENLILSIENDVIIPASGETQLDIATASCVLKNGIALGGDLNIIRSSCNGVFLSYYLTNKKKRAIAKLAQGNSVVHLYNSQLQTLKLEIPSLKEQQEIASYISALDDKIEAVQSQIEQTQEFKKGLLQQLFV